MNFDAIPEDDKKSLLEVAKAMCVAGSDDQLRLLVLIYQMARCRGRGEGATSLAEAIKGLAA